jgi:hypothetical protein
MANDDGMNESITLATTTMGDERDLLDDCSKKVIETREYTKVNFY